MCLRYPVDAPGGWQSSTVMLGNIRTVNVIPVTAMHHVLDETHYARMATKWIFVMHDGDVSETLSTNMLYVSPRQQHLRRCYPQQYQLCLVLPHFLALTTRASAQQGTSPQLRQRARSGRHCPTFVASPSKFERTPHARESGWWETWRTSFSSCELQRGPHARGSGWWGGGAAPNAQCLRLLRKAHPVRGCLRHRRSRIQRCIRKKSRSTYVRGEAEGQRVYAPLRGHLREYLNGEGNDPDHG